MLVQSLLSSCVRLSVRHKSEFCENWKWLNEASYKQCRTIALNKQTNTHKQTVNDYPHLAYRHVWIIRWDQDNPKGTGNFGGCLPHWKDAIWVLTRVSTRNHYKYISRDWPISMHADLMSTRCVIYHERRISSMTFTLAHLYGNVYILVGVAHALADSFDFGLVGQESSQKWEIPCPGRQWTAEKNLMPLALSSTEKSVILQTNSKRYIHTLPIGMCG